MAKAKAKTGADGHQFKWKLFVGGLLSIVAGYILLAMADTTIAPMLLVIGYCVLVPLSFL